MLVTDALFSNVLEYLSYDDDWTIDVETTGLRPYHGDVICGIAINACDRNFYFPFRHQAEPETNLTDGHMVLLMWQLNNQKIRHTGFNYKFDVQFLNRDGMIIPHTADDPMLAFHLLNENEYDPDDKRWPPKPTFRLKSLADKYLGAGSSKEDKKLQEILATNKWGKGDLWRLPPRVVAPYACDDVRLTRALRDFTRDRLLKQGLSGVYEGVCRYQMVVARMEKAGLHLDTERIKRFSGEADAKAQEILVRMRELSGIATLNPNSPKQMGPVLSLESTAKEILEVIPETDHRYEMVQLLREYRAYSGVESRYYEPFRNLKDEDDLLHVNLFMTGTISGRLSSGGGFNGQAMPRHAEGAMGYVKETVTPRNPGWSMMNKDYSQAELRILGHYTKDERMKALFDSGADFHGETAKDFGLPRDTAKRINFGVAYGLGEKGLSNQAHMPVKQARSYLEQYHQGRPGIRRLQNSAQQFANKNKYLPLWTGRRRHFNVPWAEPHKAMSNLIQGAVAEIMRIAICRVADVIEPYPVYMNLQVHDSILFEMPPELIPDLSPKIDEAMLDFDFYISPKVDTEIGPSWGEMTKVQH